MDLPQGHAVVRDPTSCYAQVKDFWAREFELARGGTRSLVIAAFEKNEINKERRWNRRNACHCVPDPSFRWTHFCAWKPPPTADWCGEQSGEEDNAFCRRVGLRGATGTGKHGSARVLVGLFHGFVSPFALIGSWFNPEIRIYATPNAGWWYDLGFVIGILTLGSGTGSSL
jgi:hypothetical protein